MRIEWSTLKKLIWLYRAKGGVRGVLETVSGTSPLMLLNAVKKKIVSLVQTGKVEQASPPTLFSPVPIYCNNGKLNYRMRSGLPTGCSRVEYIKNTQTNTVAYTGVYDDVDDFDIYIRVKPTAGSWYIAQSRASSNASIYGLSGSSTGATIIFSCGGSSVTSRITRDPTHIYRIHGKHKYGVISLEVYDETTGEYDLQSDRPGYAFTAATTQIGIWGNGSNFVNSGNAIYSLTIVKQNNIVFEGIPAKTYGGTAGLWDAVRERFPSTSGGLATGDPMEDDAIFAVDGEKEQLTLSVNQYDGSGTVGATLAYAESEGEVRYNASSKCVCVPVKPNTQYVVWFYITPSGGSIFRVATTAEKVSSTNTPVSTIATAMQSPVTYEPIIINSGEGARWMYVQLSTAQASSFDSIFIQEKESQVLENQTAESESLLAVGEYADTKDFISGKVTRMVGGKALNGTEYDNWTVQSNRVYTSCTNIGIRDAMRPASGAITCVCTHFADEGTNSVRLNNSGMMLFYFDTAGAGITTSADWNEYLADQYNEGTPVIVLYPLAEPYEEQGERWPDLITYSGDNKLAWTAGVQGKTISATYYTAPTNIVGSAIVGSAVAG